MWEFAPIFILRILIVYIQSVNWTILVISAHLIQCVCDYVWNFVFVLILLLWKGLVKCPVSILTYLLYLFNSSFNPTLIKIYASYLFSQLGTYSDGAILFSFRVSLFRSTFQTNYILCCSVFLFTTIASNYSLILLSLKGLHRVIQTTVLRYVISRV